MSQCVKDAQELGRAELCNAPALEASDGGLPHPDLVSQLLLSPPSQLTETGDLPAELLECQEGG